jgi:riboflavin biosynthesis pyrimidine reductase
VFSSTATGLDWREATHLWLDPARVPFAQVLAALSPIRRPHRCIVLGGATVHDWFLDRDLIDRIDLTIEPLRFGEGLTFLTRQRGDAVAELASRGFVVVDQQRLNQLGTELLVLTRL